MILQAKYLRANNPRGAALKAATAWTHRYPPEERGTKESTASMAAYQWLTNQQTARSGFY